MTQRPDTGRRVDTTDYLAGLFQPSDQLAVLVRNPHRGEVIQRLATAARILEGSFQEWLHHKNDREGRDIYVGMNPLKPSARSRTKQDILAIRHLYVDLDHDGPAALAAVQQSTLVPEPNYVLSTSRDRFQVVWRVDGVSRDGAEALLRAMARKFGADPAATDSTRVLRLPGFFNQKREERFLVQAKEYSQRVNHLLEFKVRADPSDSPYQDVRRSSARTSSARPLSQSEHDWAFAKRALARGADAEEVVRSIAKFREGEKHDVFDYARRTVLKAQAELRRDSSNASTTHSPEDENHDY